MTLPRSATRTTNRVVVFVSLSKSARFAAGRSETAHLPMFGNRLAQPLGFGVVANGVVMGVHQDNFVKLECRVLSDPVRIHHSEGRAASANSFLENKLPATTEMYILENAKMYQPLQQAFLRFSVGEKVTKRSTGTRWLTSALDCRFLCHFSWLIPWLEGFP